MLKVNLLCKGFEERGQAGGGVEGMAGEYVERGRQWLSEGSRLAGGTKRNTGK